jgi:hypothetical protein
MVGHILAPPLVGGEPFQPVQKVDSFYFPATLRPQGSASPFPGISHLLRGSCQSQKGSQEGADLLHTWSCRSQSKGNGRELHCSPCPASSAFSSQFLEWNGDLQICDYRWHTCWNYVSHFETSKYWRQNKQIHVSMGAVITMCPWVQLSPCVHGYSYHHVSMGTVITMCPWVQLSPCVHGYSYHHGSMGTVITMCPWVQLSPWVHGYSYYHVSMGTVITMCPWVKLSSYSYSWRHQGKRKERLTSKTHSKEGWTLHKATEHSERRGTGHMAPAVKGLSNDTKQITGARDTQMMAFRKLGKNTKLNKIHTHTHTKLHWNRGL